MKTWEMIKELMENPEKKFKTMDVYQDEMVAYNIENFKQGNKSSNNAIVTKFSDGKVELLTFNDFMKSREWEEVKELVDFMTAFKAFREGVAILAIKSAFASSRYRPTDGLLLEFNEDNIANGKWYIED